MARKKEAPQLTQRERESLKASHDKAARKKREALMRRVRWVSAGIGGVAGIAASLWLWLGGGFAELYDGAASAFYRRTAAMGYTVQATYLEGRSRTPMAEVTEALGFRKGDPILKLSLSEMRERLEAIPTVKEAAVERALPHSLHIRIIEREPVAIWQHEGKQALIDEEGAVMNDRSLAEYASLPLVVGEGAPKHVKEALALIAQEAELKPLVSAMVRVGDRRWNVKLKQGIEVKLPQDGADKAWQKIAKMQREQQLLMRDIRAIDLREGERTTIRLSPVPAPLPGPASARET